MKSVQGPKAPLLLQLIKWFNNPLQYLDENQRRYGNIFMLPFSVGLSPTVFIGEPKVLEFMFTHEPQIFYPIDIEDVEYFQNLMGRSGLVVTPEIEQHQKRRQLLMPSFHGKSIPAYAEKICQIASQAIHRYKGHKFDVLSLTRDIIQQTLYQCLFGLDDEENSRQLQEKFTAWADLIDSRMLLATLLFPVLRWNLGWRTWRDFCHLNRDIATLIDREIARRRQHLDPERLDILTLLLDPENETGPDSQQTEIQSQCKELITAGFFTTSAAMAWLCFCVYDHPEVMAKLQKELRSLGKDPNPVEIARLPYLTAVCKESLRKYPIAPFSFTRILQKSIEIEGYAFKSGMKMVASSYLVHQRSDIYPQPREFNPERFLTGKFSPYEYLPFGGGMRYCIGSELAMLEMKLTLATLVQTPGLELAIDRPVRPVRRVVGDVQPVNLKMLFKA